MSRELARLAQAIGGVSLPSDFRLEVAALDELVGFLDAIALRGGVLNRCRALSQQMAG